MQEKEKIKAGEAATIKSRRASGHKGFIAKRKKTGEIKAHTITHSKYTNKRKNIKLQVNPQSDDTEPAYVVKRAHKITDDHIGKRHPDLKITNTIDKSVMRKLRTQAKRKTLIKKS